jgi:hypothetical protein
MPKASYLNVIASLLPMGKLTIPYIKALSVFAEWIIWKLTLAFSTLMGSTKVNIGKLKLQVCDDGTLR